MGRDFNPNNLNEVLEYRAEEHPNKLAFTYLRDGDSQEETLSYGELDTRARGVAARLREMTHPGERVLLVFAPGLDFSVAVYGCLYAGVVAVPLFPPQPNKLKSTLTQFENTARDVQSRIILCDQMVYSKRNFLSLLAKGLRGFQWINVSKLNSTSPGFEIHSSQPKDLAFILYTSGSTGDPTGVMLTHQNVVENAKLSATKISKSGLDPTQERGFVWLPPYHVAGLFFNLLLPLYVGMPNILMSPLDFLAKPIRWLRGISRYRVVLSGGPNFAYDYCVDRISPEEREGLDLSCWKYALNGSEPIRPLTLKRFSETYTPHGFRSESFYTAYGMTEATNMVSFNDPGINPLSVFFDKADLARHKVRECPEKSEKTQTILSNGKVFNNFEIQIVDPETHIPNPPDRVGEIWLKGPCVAAGYWNKPDLTEQLFHASLASKEGPYLRTGDLGFVYKDELFISGRLKEMIIIRGKNFFPNDIENAIAHTNPVLESDDIAAFSIDVNGEENLVIIAECKKLKNADYTDIIRHIRESLSKNFNLQPYAVALIKKEALPRTATLKIRRRGCRDMFLAGKLNILAQWTRKKQVSLLAPAEHREMISLPQTDVELEAFLLKKLTSVLNVDPNQLDLNLSLPSYGLDSLAAVELSHFLETNLNIRLGVGPLFESENISSVIHEVKKLWHGVRAGDQKLTELDLLSESRLPSSISFTQPMAIIDKMPIFLTGATGFLGAFLLEQLLKETDSNIFCLVRATSMEQGALRIRNNLECFSLWDPSFTNRIRPVLGDLSKPGLGLSEAQFEELAENVGSIYHCGANVNFIFSYWDLKAANVSGTSEIIRLAAAKKTKPLHYISTVGIFPVWGQENGKSFKENDLPSLMGGHFSGYAQSKWVAESLIHQANGRGLPTTVFRVGEVIGHSETGICKPDKDAYSNMLKGVLMMGEVPRLNLNLYFAPVDMVAKGVVFLSRKKGSLGKTFHLFLNPIEGKSLIELLNSWKHPLGIKNYPEFLQDMEELNHELPHNPLAPFMPLIRSSIVFELSKTKNLLKLDSKNTLKELKNASIPTPPVHQVFRTYLNYLEKTGFLG